MVNAIWERENTLAHEFWVNGRADIPVYDMHGHMGHHPKIFLPGNTPERMREHLLRAGIKRLVFSHHGALHGHTRSEKVVDICRKFPDVFRMYIVINPNFPERIKEDLAQFDAWQPWCVGLKFHSDLHGPLASDPKYRYALDFANERKLLCLYHTWGGKTADNSAELEKVVSRYSRIKFFIGHCFYGEWDKLRPFAEAHPDNVWFELTSIPGDRGRIAELVESVGSERLIFGTDLPWFDEYQAVGGVLAADITDDDRRNILYRNVERILGKEW